MKRVAVDTETTGLNRWKGARVFAVSTCDEDGNTTWLEQTVDPKTRVPQAISRKDRARLEALLTCTKTVKTFFNLLFDANMLDAIGLPVKGPVAEVSFMARAVNNLENSYALKPLSKKYAGIDDDDEKELHAAVVLARRTARKLGWPTAEDVEADYWLPETMWRLMPKAAQAAGIPRGLCEKYGVRDAERTIVLDAMYRKGMDELDAWPAYELNMQLLPYTLRMIKRGVAVDIDEIKEARRESEELIKKAVVELKKANNGKMLNPNSPKQVATLLFDKLGLESIETTKTGQHKTGIEALLPHKENEVVRALLSYRANEKAIGTFFDKYEDVAEKIDGQLIVHAHYKQWGALTSRYTCTDPNLQQVSDPTTSNSRMPEFVVNIRRVFVPRRNHVWYMPDYKQVEVVIFADISGEPTLKQAILDGKDIHDVTTENVWGGRDNPKALRCIMELLKTRDAKRAAALLDEHDWSVVQTEKAIGMKTWRKKAKAVTFTKIFGGGVGALMSWIPGMTRVEGIETLRDYDVAFPQMAEKVAELEHRGRKDGFVRNPYGMILRVDPWASYKIVNHLVQSTAALLMKSGMIKCGNYLDEIELDAQMVLTVHDELGFEFLREHAFKSVLRKLAALMSDHGGVLSLPIAVDMDKVTERWSKKEKVRL